MNRATIGAATDMRVRAGQARDAPDEAQVAAWLRLALEARPRARTRVEDVARLARIVYARHCDAPPAPRAALAQELGISGQRVRELELLALATLRQPAALAVIEASGRVGMDSPLRRALAGAELCGGIGPKAQSAGEPPFPRLSPATARALRRAGYASRAAVAAADDEELRHARAIGPSRLEEIRRVIPRGTPD